MSDLIMNTEYPTEDTLYLKRNDEFLKTSGKKLNTYESLTELVTCLAILSYLKNNKNVKIKS